MGWGKPPAPKGQRGALALKENAKKRAVRQATVKEKVRARPADLMWRQASVNKDDTPRTQKVHACKLEAARAVGWREQCLMALNTLVLNWPAPPKKNASRRDDHRLAEAVRWLKNHSLELREAGLNCVEKVRGLDDLLARGRIGGGILEICRSAW